MSGRGISLLPTSAVIREMAGETLNFRPWEATGTEPNPQNINLSIDSIF